MIPKSGQAVAGPTGGTAEADFTPPPGNNWDVYQIGVTSSSNVPTTVSVYLNQRFYCGSNIGNQDAADGSPITVKWSDTFRVVWSGCSAGAVCNAHLLVDEYKIGAK